jgi:hypothetical protein
MTQGFDNSSLGFEPVIRAEVLSVTQADDANEADRCEILSICFDFPLLL